MTAATHNVVTQLQPPVGRISDFLPATAEGAAEVRKRVEGSPLGETVQGRFLMKTTSDREIINHLETDKAQIPAPMDREGYNGTDHAQYWVMGLVDALYLEHLVSKIENPRVVLDFGCSSGRVVRHLAGMPYEVHGCDINSKAVHFVRSNLPSVQAFHNVVYPPLPYADASVDLVYAGSIFTHIADFEEAWLMEFRRILRPGGMALFTVHTERTWSLLKSQKTMISKTLSAPHSATGLDYYAPKVSGDFFERQGFGDRCVLTRLDYPINNTNVFHSSAYIKERWGRLFEVKDILEKAHGPYQDGVLLQRP